MVPRSFKPSENVAVGAPPTGLKGGVDGTRDLWGKTAPQPTTFLTKVRTVILQCHGLKLWPIICMGREKYIARARIGTRAACQVCSAYHGGTPLFRHRFTPPAASQSDFGRGGHALWILRPVRVRGPIRLRVARAIRCRGFCWRTPGEHSSTRIRGLRPTRFSTGYQPNWRRPQFLEELVHKGDNDGGVRAHWAHPTQVRRRSFRPVGFSGLTAPKG